MRSSTLLQVSSLHLCEASSSPASPEMVRAACCSLRSLLSPNLLLLLLLLLPSSTAAQDLELKSWILGNEFTDAYRENMTTLGKASVNGGALQLTPDTRNNVDYLVDKSGRVLLPTSFKLWEDSRQPDLASNSSAGSNSTGWSQKRVISFHTSFDFNVYRESNQTIAAEGLAFIITADGDSMPGDSQGQYLGLTNAATDGNATNQLVAIEFDTFEQDFDPDDNHVGLDINSVVSNVTSRLSDFNLTISPTNATVYRAWIDYNGTERRIDVYMAIRGSPKPRAPVLNASLDLGEHLAQRSYFGFAGSTGKQYYELNCILAWNLTVEILPEDDDPSAWFVKVGVPILVVAVVVAVVLLVLAQRRTARRDERLLGTLKSLPGTPREFQYRVLRRATNNFDEKNKLGEGGFGIVYRGIIPCENVEMAVKKFSRETMQGDFLAELTIINRLRHKHLVRLLGWCHKNGKLLLVYEYMPNGGLDAHLFNAPPGRHLPWDCRYRILTGVASALHYLHNEYDQKVVHRDLKASNVLLDAAFNARLGDFGLARAIDNERTSYAEHSLEGVPGTMGYIAPECFHTGKATCESDVFGFGAVVLEVVCGRRPSCDIAGFRFLTDWVWKLHRDGSILDAVDACIDGDFVAEDAQRLLLLGLACSHPNPGDRPKTHAITQIISKSVPPPEVPPSRPAFVWPSADISGDDMAESTPTTTTPTCSTLGVTSSFYTSTTGMFTTQLTSRNSTDISMA